MVIDEARYRHRRARTLLADKQMTIEAVGFEMGFSEASSFSRAVQALVENGGAGIPAANAPMRQTALERRMTRTMSEM